MFDSYDWAIEDINFIRYYNFDLKFETTTSMSTSQWILLISLDNAATYITIIYTPSNILLLTLFIFNFLRLMIK